MATLTKRTDTAAAKVVLLGDSGVGKSSIALRFARDEFLTSQEPTIGAAFLSRTIVVPSGVDQKHLPSTSSNDTKTSNKIQDSKADPKGGQTLKFEIWDTAGQERYRSLAPIYYRGASGALIVYDITNRESLSRAQTWIRELRATADPTLAIALIGNKKDLESLRQVPAKDGQALAEEENVNGFFETSAKENENIETVFASLARSLLEQGRLHTGGGGVKVSGATRLEQPPADKPGSSGGCC